jgi:hypothetical protein
MRWREGARIENGRWKMEKEGGALADVLVLRALVPKLDMGTRSNGSYLSTLVFVLPTLWTVA